MLESRSLEHNKPGLCFERNLGDECPQHIAVGSRSGSFWLKFKTLVGERPQQLYCINIERHRDLSQGVDAKRMPCVFDTTYVCATNARALCQSFLTQTSTFAAIYYVLSDVVAEFHVAQASLKQQAVAT